MKYDIMYATYLLQFVNDPDGWDMDHVQIGVDGTEDEPRFSYLIPCDEKAEGFVCNEKLLDSFDENVTSECYAMHKDVNHIPFLFTEIRKIGRFILLVAEYHRFVP